MQIFIVFALIYSILAIEVQKTQTKTEKLFYTTDEKLFFQELQKKKEESSTLVFFAGEKSECFYPYSPDIKELVLSFEKALWELDSVYSSFSPFAKKQIIQSALLDEMRCTNEIEGIRLTRHDIFALIQKAKETASSKKLLSMVNAYSLLLSKGIREPSSLKEIRDLYDKLLGDAINKQDLPDGRYFREGPVSVVGSVGNLHEGLFGEKNVEKAMSIFLSSYHEKQIFFPERMLISHYLFEAIHPFYDGNGRLGRFLMSIAFSEETHSLFSFLISSTIAKNKSKYYQAFKNTEGFHNFGDLSAFVEPMLGLFQKGAEDFKRKLEQKQKKITCLVESPSLDTFSKSERKVWNLIVEGSVFSEFGMNNQEILEQSKVSKRTLLYTIKKMREKSLLEDTKFGALTYHKLKY